MAGIDTIIASSVDAVRKSGIVEASTLMATVTAVSGGTLTVARNGDTYPSVRLISGYVFPKPGDLVEIMRTAGGWICIGMLQNVGPVSGQVVDQRAGFNSITPNGTSMTYKTITFPAMRGESFYGQMTVSSSVIGTTINGWEIDTVTATSIRVGIDRDNTTTTNFHWTAYGIKN